MNKRKIFGIAILVATAFGAASTANASCYHKIGALCKSGYASGYLSDCSTPCTTGRTEMRAKGQKAVVADRKSRRNSDR